MSAHHNIDDFDTLTPYHFLPDSSLPHLPPKNFKLSEMTCRANVKTKSTISYQHVGIDGPKSTYEL